MKKMMLIGLAIATLAGQVAMADGWHNGSYYTPHYVPHGREFHDLPYGFCRLILGGLEFFYAEGLYYRRVADHYVVVPAPVGAVVTTIPSGCTPVIVEGTPYYTVNGVTYLQTTYGYQVVPPPRVVVVNNPAPVPAPPVSEPAENATAAPVADETNNDATFTVNIPNSKGGFTPILLKRSGSGFIGPQGEFYPDFPRVEQLSGMGSNLILILALSGRDRQNAEHGQGIANSVSGGDLSVRR